MEEYFNKFLENIELKPKQKKDAVKKYNGVCEKVHNSFYDTDYDGTSKYLFGSYKKKTNIRPMIPTQDVDVLIKLPHEVYEQYDSHEGNGQSKLIQKIKDVLNSKYTTTDNIKGWGKVILVEFSEGKHNVELLPAFENEDGTFKIPNSSDGGKWDVFNPREEIDNFKESNDNTKGLTRKLSKIVKKWAREVSSLSIKSYQIEENIIVFLDEYKYEDKKISIIVRDFYQYLVDEINTDDKSYVETALKRINKAIDYIEEEKYEKAVEKWKKVFGDDFPKTISVKKTALQKYSSKMSSPYIALGEQFIEEIVSVEISPTFNVELDCEVKTNGFRAYDLSYFLSMGLNLKKGTQLNFFIKKHNIVGEFEIMWKVRNYGVEAENQNCLRGEIVTGGSRKSEITSYEGDHLVECYIVQNGRCVATGNIHVPIK